MALTTEEKAGLLQRYLEGEDAPCPLCGYNLHHLTGTKCPECGATLELRVGSAELKLGKWLAALLSLAIAFGFSSLLILSLFIFNIQGNPVLRALRQTLRYWPSLLLAFVAGGLLMVVLRRRRRFCRLSDRSQTAWLLLVLAGSLFGLAGSMWWLCTR